MDKTKLTRGELLKTGMGLTLLTVAGCSTSSRLARDQGVEEDEGPAPSYTEAPKVPTGLDWSRGIAFGGDSLWVAGDSSLRKFDRNGEQVETFPMPDAAQAVAVALDQAVYGATSDQVVPIGGTPFASLGPRSRIVALAASEDTVYAGDAGNRQVVLYDRQGNIKGKIEGLIVPSPYMGVALAPNGDLLVSNPGRHRVERYTADGEPTGSFGKAGQEMEAFCGCCNPSCITVLPNGDVLTSEKGWPRVKVLSPQGELKAVVANTKSFDQKATGLDLAVDGERIFVLDPWEGAVRVFQPA